VDEHELVKKHQKEVASYLWSVMEETFQGQGHWKSAPMNRVIASLVRHRPRDIVKLCNGAAVYAKRNHHSKLLTGDFEATFESYSHERLQDLVNEFKTELNMINAPFTRNETFGETKKRTKGCGNIGMTNL
jgi:hypothetical protein